MTPPPPASSPTCNTWLIGLGVAVLLASCLACGLIAASAGAYYVFFAATRTAAPSANPRATATTAPTKTPRASPSPTASVKPRAAEELEIPIEGFQHVDAGDEVTYDHYPPSSGSHYPQAAPWGVYDDPVPEGYFVHNLEHSGIVILYQCPDGCPELAQQLSDFYDNAPPEDQFGEVKFLITPYERELPARVVALAWGRQLNLYQFDEVDQAALLDFYNRYVNEGPEVIP